MSSIQFTIPRRAADAVDFLALRRHGAAAKLPRNTIECSTISAPIGQSRITTSIDMAAFLVEALRIIAADADEHGQLELVIACAQGVKSAFDAIDNERARPSDESPAAHTKPAPN